MQALAPYSCPAEGWMVLQPVTKGIVEKEAFMMVTMQVHALVQRHSLTVSQTAL